jgi:deazaflavin-dependent oxidoreductase (nitroreductase family)
MRAVLARVVVGLIVVIAGVGVVYVMGMRRRSPTVINAVRRVGRATKSLPLKTAGTGQAYASVVEHVGRTSGKTYRTPVHAVRSDEGFAIALPYGSGSDWVKNVLARGAAVVQYQGESYSVDQPTVVPLPEVATLFTSRDRLAHRLFGVAECLVVRRSDLSEASDQVRTSVKR